ncbi:UDP-N-acetylmuramoylalanyl-D-glutamyl-2,6- diaminopimelate--D-alanyl-D-alanine ligase [Rubellimicrobium mesophilum DSM 19309]|uniref:UDP-N-acetylmuramoyl-tripeptide--D-alanyl-D-alanine ligase n=1 Tax=Rubellimicrobium mesophilum DSM 19309 TaxID=442562 RepID=A0A017HN86_9RHOB|nr:UDP-N-acetylmuramoyl-tripeptide--D-alanyl-D-alanine ligase [Rubellimicrobium mesophilum]EYD75249.1 UDP-N-acetylmuramoylalanyl-D-glutamyl-2,6- diaminopimelate--D-alanyl-D-alanine ligase [Rubellimicrobium mesophilum DSM 19309]
MSLWTSRDAVAATGGASTREWEADGVSIDTRTIRPGDLFVALKAARDGHEFVAQALEKGAAAALVTHRPEGVAEDAPLLIVPDVQAALEDLGRAGRARSRARVVGITGSVGKTSTKEMLRAALATQGRVHAAEASYNNHWGVPLTLARLPVDADYAVIEIGMNHPGEIAPLAKQARPHVVLITTVGAAHLEAFGSVEGIAEEKAAIAEGLEPGGTAVLPADVAQLAILRAAAERAGARVATFGTSEGADYRLLDLRVGNGASVGRAVARGTDVHLKVGTEGAHFAVNALGALAAAEALGADAALALNGLAGWTPPKGRGGREEIPWGDGRVMLLDDAFNANPISMAAGLAVLAGMVPEDGAGRVARGRRIAILGDMLELGPNEAGLHAGLAEDPAMESVAVVHCVGPRMKALHEALPEERRGRWAETPEALIDGLGRLLDAGDIVLVKGSKGSRVSLVVDAIRRIGQGAPSTKGS